jgi:fumarate hydratase, class I
MEAVHKVEIENFPAFIVINDQGEDFYASISESRVAVSR